MLTNNPHVQKMRFEETRSVEGKLHRTLIVETTLQRPNANSAAHNDNAYASLAQDLKQLQFMADNGFGDFQRIEVRTIN